MANAQPPMFRTLGDITVLPEYADVLSAAGLTSLEAMMAHAGVARLDKPGLQTWRQRLRIELPAPDGTTLTAYLKRYRSPPIHAQRQRIVHGGLRHGTAWIEWYWSHRLIADGINVAPPIALAESIRGGRELASAILTAAAPGQSLESLAALPHVAWDRDIIAELARFVGRFHGLGYVHRDLYLAHVFFDRDAQPGRHFCLIDLHRVMRPRCFRRRWFVKDLAALNYSTPASLVSTPDRIRFLITYLRENPAAGPLRVPHQTEPRPSGSGLSPQTEPRPSGSGLRSSRKEAFRRALRRLARDVVRKTTRIARHDARRVTRLADQRTVTPEAVP